MLNTRASMIRNHLFQLTVTFTSFRFRLIKNYKQNQAERKPTELFMGFKNLPQMYEFFIRFTDYEFKFGHLNTRLAYKI